MENKISNELIQGLWEKVNKGYDTYEIRKEYKEKDPNYYGNICIILNVMSAKKETLRTINGPITFQNLKYIKQAIAGEIRTKVKESEIITGYTIKEVEYDYIDYPEGIGTKKTEKILQEILREANDILNEQDLNLENAKKWVKNYRKYIIMTYGRWSKQYEKYMNTAFEMQIILTSPNILLLAMRRTMRNGIESVISEINKF